MPFFSVDQIYQKANEGNPDNPTFTHKFIEERIQFLLFTAPVSKNILNPDFSFEKLPLTEEEEFMILLLSKFQKDFPSTSFLCTKYRYLFGFNHPFSSLVSLIEQDCNINFSKESLIIESYATTFAQLERLYDINDFSQSELERAQVTQEDLAFLENSKNYSNDESAIDFNSPDIVESISTPIEQIESDFSYLTQMRVKIFAFLQTKELSIPIMLKNFLIGDSELSNDVDFDLRPFPDYKPEENHLILALIMLKNDLNFYLENAGAGIIVVDGFQIFPGEVTNLADNSLLEMSGCDFAFSINSTFMNKLKDVVLKISSEK